MTPYEWNQNLDNNISGGWLTIPSDIIDGGKVLSLRCYHISKKLLIIYMEPKYMKDFIVVGKKDYDTSFNRQYFINKNPKYIFIKTLFEKGIES